MKQYYSLLLVFCITFCFYSCDDVLECIINVRPELHNNDMDIARVDSYYFETITAEVKNEPNDNDYDYFFSVSGNVPKGLDIVYEYRRIIIEGIPKETGRYTIRVSLDVVALNEFYFDEFGNEIYHAPLCTNTTSKVYTIVVR
ncbi:hypothetical protein [Seonamhaeicola sp. ML3]|uniref:hypothetical protein n=1 Tax=Seonamhaeicola sp. ML3 TaxID=2937786 RepID=UPI00200C627C|nr:hypothetical protein [Seonamhaeicola sp. ML3]